MAALLPPGLLVKIWQPGQWLFAAELTEIEIMISVIRHAELHPEEISALHRTLADYYAKPPDSYYEIADQAAGQYTPGALPFHCDLVRRVRTGMSVLELGCGSAHLCPYVEAAGGVYTGTDHSEKLLEINRQRFPARTFSLSGKM